MELSAGYLLGLTRQSTDRTNEDQGSPLPPAEPAAAIAAATTTANTAAAKRCEKEHGSILIYMEKRRNGY